MASRHLTDSHASKGFIEHSFSLEYGCGAEGCSSMLAFHPKRTLEMRRLSAQAVEAAPA